MDKSAFQVLIDAFPASMEVELKSSDAASTAFFLAIRAGWIPEEVAGNAYFQWKRTHNMGIVIEGMRTLSQNPPSDRAKPKPPPGRPKEWVPEVKVWQAPEEVARRVALLRRIAAGEEPPEAMETLIASD